MISRNNKSVVLKQSDQEQDDDQGVIVSIMGTGATEARPTSVIVIRIRGSGAARARPASFIITLEGRALGTGATIPWPTI